MNDGQLLFKSGSCRRLKSFQLAQLCFDITVRFVELYFRPSPELLIKWSGGTFRRAEYCRRFGRIGNWQANRIEVD